jgi:RNA polymerase sigma-70 factor (ECF subfamily)
MRSLPGAGAPRRVGRSAHGEGPQLHRLEDPGSDLSRSRDGEHDRHVAQTLLESIRLEFQPATWHAFESTVRDGRPTAEVAAELALSENAVLIAKSRVLKRLCQRPRG